MYHELRKRGTSGQHPDRWVGAMHHQHGEKHHHCVATRRSVVAMLAAAAGVHSAMGLRYALAQGAAQGGAQGVAAGPDEWMIDTHHHIYPPRYTRENLKRIVDDSSALPAAAYTSWAPGWRSSRWTRPMYAPPSYR